jgi:glycosyltransferase involved in cell wall biosynthesis
MRTDRETARLTAQASAISGSPTVSVVIPAYGHRDFIGRTLDSVFAQTWTDYEIIIINDGSPDDTEAVLQPWLARSAIRYVKQKNAGVAAARNRGIGLAKGEFIALLDDDDLWPPNKLASQVELMRSNPTAVMVYGNLSYIDSRDAPYIPLDWEGKPLFARCHGPDNLGPSGQVFEAFAEENWIISPGQTLIRRSTLIGMGEPPLDPAIWGADDWDLWLRLADRGHVLYRSEITLHYRFHANNTSRNAVRMNANSLKVLRKHRNQQRSCPERFRLLGKTYTKWLDVNEGHLFYCAWHDYMRGALRDSLRHLFFLASVNPRVCKNRRYIRLFRDIMRSALRKIGRKANTL